jgi:ATP-dependent DNA ligase
MERRSVLERILKPVGDVQLGNYLEREGTVLFSLTKERGMEGIVAKRKDSIYRPGKRTSDGIKIKSRPQQEFGVGGFTGGKGSRKVESVCARIATGNFTIMDIPVADSARKA